MSSEKKAPQLPPAGAGKSVAVFNEDVQRYGSYVYTRERFSSRHTLGRLTTEIGACLERCDPLRSVLDVGHGDGTLTNLLQRRYPHLHWQGIDLAPSSVARCREQYPEIGFRRRDVYQESTYEEKVDCALMSGVLHHLERPQEALRTLATVSRHLIILETNGYNPVRGFVNTFSPYARRHGEKSYLPFRLRSWCRNAGFRVEEEKFFSYVPFEFPTPAARPLARAEAFLERRFLNLCFSGLFLMRLSAS